MDNIAEVEPVVIQPEPVGNTRTTGNNQLYRWAFTLKSTYKGDDDIDELIEPESLWSVLKMFCKEFIFQLELSETGYEHYQGCFSLINKHRRAEVKNILGYRNVHVEPIKNWAASKKYCSKEATRIKGPWDIYSKFIKTIQNLNYWQGPCFTLLESPPDDRSIYWIYDTAGNMGKSAFCKYCAVYLGATVINNGSFADIAFCIPENPKIVMFDLTRSIEGRVNYSALEALKNGMIFSGKYESKTKMFNPPHVFVFSNFGPDLSAMSADRWRVIDLNAMG